ncbi:MAG: sigma 54-interacting transcriptional regulator [Dysgonamonadaceae bacterium]|jgi:transcriptional regulatory protein RtcR|nr:sigma 54-interacting transcriptional regulator [Dysgonamonadaceae bacterium]
MAESQKPAVVFGFIGTIKDQKKDRLGKQQWRPTISIFKTFGQRISCFHLIIYPDDPSLIDLANELKDDIEKLSPKTKVCLDMSDIYHPWDFKEVYEELSKYCKKQKFNTEKEDYFFHTGTGTHPILICISLLIETNRFKGKLLQTIPPDVDVEEGCHQVNLHDLPISVIDHQPDKIRDDTRTLKSGFDSINTDYNRVIDDIKTAAITSKENILLLGETGTGKSVVALQIHKIRQERFGLKQKPVDINCSTITADTAKATLFGYKKGDFTGAVKDQAGLLKQADGGTLFLDEIGELPSDVQAMMLTAIETKKFKVFGIHEEENSNFLLICGTNRDLDEEVRQGRFREDLLARIDFWSFRLPSLRERLDDIPKLITYYMDKWSLDNENRWITFDGEARGVYLQFACDKGTAIWPKNLRELNHSVRKMCYHAGLNDYVIGLDIVEKEIRSLKGSWNKTNSFPLIDEKLVPLLEKSDKIILEQILQFLRDGGSLTDAGKEYFSSAADSADKNYSDYVKKFLTRCAGKLPGGYRYKPENGNGYVLKKG